jgi:excisionase family DNA binding protein
MGDVMSTEDIVPRADALRKNSAPAKRIEPPGEMLTVPEASAYLRISRGTLNNLIRQKELKSIKIKQRRFIRMQAIREYLDQREAETGA